MNPSPRVPINNRGEVLQRAQATLPAGAEEGGQEGVRDCAQGTLSVCSETSLHNCSQAEMSTRDQREV